MKIIIDPEFQSQIPPLTPEEYSTLEESILAEGCRDRLTVWGNILVDGHNRYEICTRHGIPYRTVNREFDDRDVAAAWIDNNQLSRRNLTRDQMSELRARYYNRLKSKQGGDRKSKDQNDTLINAAEVVAAKFSVSPATIKRDAAKAAGKVRPPKRPATEHPVQPVEQQNTVVLPLYQYEEMAAAREQLIAANAEIATLRKRINVLEKELANCQSSYKEKQINLETIKPTELPEHINNEVPHETPGACDPKEEVSDHEYNCVDDDDFPDPPATRK